MTGKIVAFFLLFGLFIFVFHNLSGGAEAEGASSVSQPRTVTIQRDHELETGINRRYADDYAEADDWGE